MPLGLGIFSNICRCGGYGHFLEMHIERKWRLGEMELKQGICFWNFGENI
jgi:hypothetical protein